VQVVVWNANVTTIARSDWFIFTGSGQPSEAFQADAQFALGSMYSHAEGFPQDYAEAAHWYRKAANQGHDLSQFYLGTSYAHGLGVPQNYALAYMWLNLAAIKSSPAARNLRQDKLWRHRLEAERLRVPLWATRDWLKIKTAIWRAANRHAASFFEKKR
jgi:TPR repeat protein